MNTPALFFDWVLATSLSASLLTGAVLLIQTLLHNHLSPRWRYVLWLPVLAALLAPPFVESRWSAEHLLTSSAFSQTSDASPAPDHQDPANPGTPAGPMALSWQTILLAIWATGSAGLLLVGAVSFTVALRRYSRSSLPPDPALLAEIQRLAGEIRLGRLPQVWVSPLIDSPVVSGLWRPVLMLPERLNQLLTPAQAGLVLKHELMHLKRGDLPMNFLLCVLMALHWFNPLLWLAFYKSRTDREAACDAQVLAQGSATSRLDYGHALLKIGSAFRPQGLTVGFVGMFQRGAALRSRVRSIASPRTCPTFIRGLVVVMIGVLTFLGSTRAQSLPGLTLGQSFFRTGDSIRITSIERDADAITITGEYDLASHDEALLGFYITSLVGSPTSVEIGPNQQITIQKGTGTFSLTHLSPYPGLPHLTLYNKDRSAFGCVYFGTQAEAEKSEGLKLDYMADGEVVKEPK